MDALLKRIEALEKENAVLRARAEVQNLAARYEDLMLSGRGARILRELWTKAPDARLEYCASGVYGGERIGFFYDKAAVPGRFSVYQLTTPYIEVSEDGASARGLWSVIGAESDAGELGPVPPKTLAQRAILSSRDENGRLYRAEWVWQRLEMLLRREDGSLKIYSLHVRELFRCPYGESWVSWAEKRLDSDGLRLDALFTPASVPEEQQRPPEFNASFASTDHWQYSTDALPPEGLLG